MTESSKNLKEKWGSIKLAKLPKEIDINRLKQLRPIIADEPLLPSVLNCYLDTHLNIYKEKMAFKNEESISESKDESNRLEPSIDSYIVNTIKLNRILRNQVSFDQIDFFTKSTKKKLNSSATRKKINSKPTCSSTQQVILSGKEVRECLKNFIVIMSLHCGHTRASIVAMDILIDVLDNFLESFFKLCNNLQSIHQVDLNANESEFHPNNFYSSQHLVAQALEESGIGTIEDIKKYYMNDIIHYFKQTYAKVSKLYEEYKAKKLEKESSNLIENDSNIMQLKSENDLKLEQFMKDNDFLNDESNSILGELLTDLNGTHFDEMNKLLQIIGPDPFSVISDEFQSNADSNKY